MNKTLSDGKTISESGDGPVEKYQLVTGSRFGMYRIIRPLGRGGMGEVYEVEHTVLEKRYALKLLPPEIIGKSGMLERFKREAKVMAQLQHGNIIHVDEFGETDGKLWLRMELAEGVDLQGKRVTSLQQYAEACGGKISQQELSGILIQILSGLQYAHECGVIHQDLKPANILFSSGSVARSHQHAIVKISDFGLLQFTGIGWLESRKKHMVSKSAGNISTVAEQKASTGTSTRALLGTYEYMSPEQKRGEPADQRSDIFSIGLMVYRMLTGITDFTFELPSETDQNLHTGWDTFVKDTLRPDKRKRIGDISALIAVVTSIQSETDIANTGTFQNEKKDTRFCNAQESTAGKTTLQRLTNTIGQEFVWISPGTFMMGSPSDEFWRNDDEELHQVTLTNGFYLQTTPVTQEQWKSVMGRNPAFSKDGGENCPVENVSWNDVQKFIFKLNQSENTDTYRLPTEAEWEYACRAGSTTAFANGDIMDEETDENLDVMGWYGENCDSPEQVGQKTPNAWGLYDMHGNVQEWCQDWYEQYPSCSVTNPTGPSSGTEKVNRGGSYQEGASYCRAAQRSNNKPGERDYERGFRLVQTKAVSGGLPFSEVNAQSGRGLSQTAKEICIHGNHFINSIGQEFLWIPPGAFMMGSSQAERDWAAGPEGGGDADTTADESDPQSVFIENAFWLGRTEVTVGQFRSFVNETNFKTDAECRGEAWCIDWDNCKWDMIKGKSWRAPNYGFKILKNHPVTCISWNDAMAFCRWLNQTGKSDLPAGYEYRLPTEQEWEYACRGGLEGTRFWWGDSMAEGKGRCNVRSKDHLRYKLPNAVWDEPRFPFSDGFAFVSPVDHYGDAGRNGFGLADMLGNVWEWCITPFDSESRVLRGGSFDDVPGYVRCAHRLGESPSEPNSTFGFRVCVGIPVSF